MRPRTALSGAGGVLATAVGAGLLFAPDLLLGLGPLDAAVTAFSGVETTTAGLAAGVLVLGAFFLTVRRSPTPEREGPPSSLDSRFERAATTPPERATASDQSLTGAAFDHEVRQAIEEGGDAFRDVRSVLYRTATSACAERMAVPESEAATLVDRGEWTDDPVAARFLARGTAPLSMRLRRWLVPVRERERRIERTVAAIEQVSRR